MHEIIVTNAHFSMTGNSIELEREQRSRGGTFRDVYLSLCSCIVTSHLERAYRPSGYMLRILSGFYRNLPLSDVTFHENV